MSNNEEPEFDMWEALGVRCAGYNSDTDQLMIDTMKWIRKRGAFCSDIAEALSVSNEFIELLQSILCSANLCEYGTSPRCCWFKHDFDIDGFIEKCEKQYKEKWEAS